MSCQFWLGPDLGLDAVMVIHMHHRCLEKIRDTDENRTLECLSKCTGLKGVFYSIIFVNC